MDDNGVAKNIAAAAEAGETEWPSHDEFVRRFSIDRQLFISLGSQLHALGWWLEPYTIKNYEIIPNAFGDGRPSVSGQPQGYRLIRV